MRVRPATWGAALVVATSAASARAEPPVSMGAPLGAAPSSAPKPPPSDDADVTARLAFVERALEAEAASTHLWRSSWLGIYGAVTLGETYLVAVAADRAARISAGVSLAEGAIGFTFRLVSPATGAYAAGQLRGAPAATPAERREKLRRAEALLRTVATEERFSNGWFPRIGGALVVAGGAAITFAANRGSAGAGWFSAGSGIVASQLELLTQPTAGIRAWEAYRRDGAAARFARTQAPSVTLVPAAGGLAVRGSF